MINFAKGIIEIEGYDVALDATPEEIKEKLGNKIIQHKLGKRFSDETMIFENIQIIDRCFDVTLHFFKNKLSSIILYGREELTLEEQFNLNNEWIKELLGEPHHILDDVNRYVYDNARIQSCISFNRKTLEPIDAFVSIIKKTTIQQQN